MISRRRRPPATVAQSRGRRASLTPAEAVVRCLGADRAPGDANRPGRALNDHDAEHVPVDGGAGATGAGTAPQPGRPTGVRSSRTRGPGRGTRSRRGRSRTAGWARPVRLAHWRGCSGAGCPAARSARSSAGMPHPASDVARRVLARTVEPGQRFAQGGGAVEVDGAPPPRERGHVAVVRGQRGRARPGRTERGAGLDAAAEIREVTSVLICSSG